jgi:hypothetical protein
MTKRDQQKKTGKIQYLGRAFVQDANQAMKSDIVRGLIELITNADDAYASMPDVTRGKILVEVEHRRGQPWRVIVRDRATGMTAGMLEARLTRIGDRTSGFESGEAKRGNLGRGAKDLVAFGEVTFESIRDDRYGNLILKPSGSYELEEGDATKDQRKRLGIPKNGTVVTVFAQPGIRCPQHDNLQRKLATHFQLRDILSDATRDVELTNLNDESRAPLVYTYPMLPEIFRGRLIIDGYPEAIAELTMYRNSSRDDDGPEDPGRPSGILVKGRRAIYENTLFGLEGDTHAGWFSGQLTCPYIDSLAREYDDLLSKEQEPSAQNPMPIISRTRDGLNEGHPFYQALRQAAEVPLRELVAKEHERMRKESRLIESDATRSALERVSKEVNRLIAEEFTEIEAEELPGSQGEGQPLALTIAPEQAFAYMGEDRTLTIAARRAGLIGEEVVSIEVDPEGVVELLTPTAPLGPHSRREDILVAQVRVRPKLVGESTMISASVAGRSAHALIEVKPPRVVIEEPILQPAQLTFERPSYRIGWLRKKELVLVAPATVVAEAGDIVEISSSDPGVVVKTPKVTLLYDDSVEYYRARVQLEARVLDATAVVTARAGDSLATAHVKIVRKEDGPEFPIRIVPEEWGAFRAVVEEEEIDGRPVKIFKIAGRHPALAPSLGPHFEGQDTPVVRAIIAEIVADLAARVVVAELYRSRRNTEAFDSDRFYREHYKRVTRFLPRLQRLLVGRDLEPQEEADVAPMQSPSLGRSAKEAARILTQ